MSTPSGHLRLVLVRTRFPENIGSVGRAAANFGAADLALVTPELWNREKALPMATAQGAPFLDNLTVTSSLADAVASRTLVVGTTARTGGWRRHILTPRHMAEEVAARLREGEDVAIVFGPEDRGLENEDLEHCNRLVSIPTAPEDSSLNVAQAALLLLYECFLARGEDVARPHLKGERTRHIRQGELSRRIRQEERALLHATLKETLMHIDFLQADNPDYFFLPLARFFDRADVRRHEMDLFMGLCRQIRTKSRGQ